MYHTPPQSQPNSVKIPKTKRSGVARTFGLVDANELSMFLRDAPSTHYLPVLDEILYKGMYYEHNFIGRKRIATKLGISIHTVTRAIGFGISCGALKVTYRFNQSNLYTLNHLFNLQHVRDSLRDILPSLRHFSLMLLTSLFIGLSGAGGTLTRQGFKKVLFQVERFGQKTVVIASNKKELKERVLMQSIYPYISTISESIPLTSVGACKLMAFRESIIRTAMAKVSKSRSVKKPWSLLFKLCLDLSREQSITPDWALVSQLCTMLKEDSTGPCVEHEGFREGVAPDGGSSAMNPSNKKDSRKGTTRRPAQVDTSGLVQDLSDEKAMECATDYFNNLIVDTVDKHGYTITAQAKQKVWGARNPYWSKLSASEQKEVMTLFPTLQKYKQTNSTPLDDLNSKIEGYVPTVDK